MKKGLCIALAGLAFAAPAWAQIDPFGALHPPPPGVSAKAGAAPPSSGRTGVTSVTGAVGRSYAGSQTGGFVSLAQLDMAPAAAAPFAVRLDGFAEKYVRLRPKVAVPHYGLAIAQATKSTASAAGAGSDITPRRTTIATRLYGFTDEMGAALAEEAYQDLVSRLAAAGFEVVGRDAVTANARYGAVPRHPGPYRATNAFAGWSVYGPASLPLIKGYSTEQGMAAMAASGALLALGHVSQELDAVLLLPRLQIDYAAAEGTGHRNFVGGANVEVELRYAINPWTRTDFIAGNERGGAMGGGWTMKGAGTDEPFAILVKADDRSDSVALHNAFATAGFGSIYRQSLVYDAEISPKRFTALTRAAYQSYNSALVAALRKARGS
jgi:hypothetical protein